MFEAGHANAGNGDFGFQGDAHAFGEGFCDCAGDGWPFIEAEARSVSQKAQLIASHAHEFAGVAETGGLLFGAPPDFGGRHAGNQFVEGVHGRW